MIRIDTINIFFSEGENSALDLLRLDLPDPVAGGNKSFKLKYNLEEMQRTEMKRLLTFGGAFSNHIAAVATAGKKNKLETIGIIRGDELNENSNEVLKYAASCGMKLVFISRDEYRKRNEKEFCEKLMREFGPAYLLPEGGSNELAVNGCKEIISEQTDQYDVIVCPVGTGATLAGIIAAAKKHQEIIGVAVLEGKNYLENEIKKLLEKENVIAKWKLNHDFTFGGYGKSSPVLEKFIDEMKSNHAIPLDKIYSGKTLFALHKMKTGITFNGKRFLFIHSGGYAFDQLTRVNNLLSE